MGNPAILPESPGELAGRTVLVVEDEQDGVEVLRQITGSAGARVLTARDGLDALRVLGRHHVDLALVDLLMPLMDGYELIAHLRREPAPLGRMPLIAVTALGHDEDLVRTWNEGADAHVTKPVDYDLIMGVIRRVMATRRVTDDPPSRPSRRPPRRADS